MAAVKGRPVDIVLDWIGYASAIAERDFGLPRGSVSVRGGIVTVSRGAPGAAEGMRLRGALGAKQVHIPVEGGGYIFHRYPRDLERWTAQAGVEYQGDPGWLGGALRPVGAMDLQSRQGIGWDPEVSLRAGVELVRPPVGRRIHILGEYYNRRNQNGQFSERRLQCFGLGLHVYFN